MELQEIEVLIDKKGQVQLHVRGIKGSGCLEITHNVESALGSQVILREMTPESQDNSKNPAKDINPVNIHGK